MAIELCRHVLRVGNADAEAQSAGTAGIEEDRAYPFDDEARPRVVAGIDLVELVKSIAASLPLKVSEIDQVGQGKVLER